MKKILLRAAVALLVIAAVTVAAAFLFLDRLIKKGVETAGPAVTKVDVKLDAASVSPLSGRGTLRGFFVGNPPGFKTESAFKAGELTLALRPASLLRGPIVIDEINVQAPEITFEGSLKGSNVGKILDNIQAAVAGLTGDAKSSTGNAAHQGEKFQVGDFKITGGKIHVSATLLGGRAVTVPLPDIHLTGLGQSTGGITADQFAHAVAKAVVEKTLSAVGEVFKDAGKAVTGAAKSAGKEAGADIKKAADGIKNLFKKKP